MTTKPQTSARPNEIRGLWVTRWNYKSAGDVHRIVSEAHTAGFNTLFWQVRGQGDALYRSQLEPWSAELTGTLGKDPGFDPLQAAVTEAHACGMQIHAWINVFPVWKGTAAPPHSQPEPILHAHPDWLAVDDQGQPIGLSDKDYAFASPGNPAVRKHVAAVVRDLASHYDVDGLHLDYIRYGGRQYSHDAVSLHRFELAKRDNIPKKGLRTAVIDRRSSYDDWQREQVNDTVRLISRTLQRARPASAGKPRVQLSAAVWGVYRNEWGWPGVSQGYRDYYQDPRAWIRDGIVDFVCPMIYWPITKKPGAKLDWATLAADHVKGCGSDHVVLGIQANYEAFAEIAAEIAEARKLGARGVVIFAYSALAERNYFPPLANGPFHPK